jgi:hypothetical protein
MVERVKNEQIDIKPFSSLALPLIDAWAELIDRHSLNPSLQPGWLSAVLKSWEIPLASIQVFLVHNAGVLEGVIPFLVETRRTFGLPLKVLSLTSNFVSYHPEIVCSKNVKKNLRSFLLEATKWDKTSIQGVVDDGPTAQAVREICAEQGWLVLESPVDLSPFLPLEGSWEDLQATKKRKFRYKVRKRNENLEMDDEFSMKWYRNQGDVTAYLDAFFAVEAKSWKSENGVEVSASNKEGRYYSELLPFLAENDALLANVLWHKETPIAYSLCCHWNGWVGHLKTGFNRSFEDISAGALVIDSSMKAAYDLNAREFDFLGTPGKMQPDPHKMHWTKQTRRHVSFEIFSSGVLPKLVGFAKLMKQRLSQ